MTHIPKMTWKRKKRTKLTEAPIEGASDSGRLGVIFSQLSASAVPGKLVTQKTGFVFAGREIFAGRDSDGYPHLLIPETSSGSALTGPLSAFIFSETRSLEDGDGNLQSFVDLACHSKDVDGIFAPICLEISETLSTSSAATQDGLLTLFESIIQKWRDVLEALAEITSPKNQKIGLIGELVFLEQLMRNRGKVAFDAWFGPDKSRHDFEFKDEAFEVKSSTVLHRKICTIHGLNQLSAAPGTELQLVHLQFEEAVSGISVDTVLSELTSFGIGLHDLRAKISEHWPLAHPNPPSWFTDFHVKVVSASLFPVDANFPKISSKELAPAALPHLLDVSYNLLLDGLPSSSFSNENRSWTEVLKNA